MKDSTYIYSAVRTPIGKFNGAFCNVAAPDLGACAIREALSRSTVAADQIDSVIFGNVISAGIGQAPARQAALKSGLPDRVGATTVSKVCGSGLQAVIYADQAIRLGQADFIVAGGMENMSRAPFLMPQLRRGHRLGDTELVDSMIHDGLWDQTENSHMGELCERLAKNMNYRRENQDAYAIESYTRAQQAQENCAFSDEIVPVSVPHKTGAQMIEKDEQPFSEDLDQLPMLKPVFDPKGTITKGNGAKINDGAAALVVGKFSDSHSPLARIVGVASHAQSPATFGLAPVAAIQKVLAANRLRQDDIDLFEINEAFAVLSLAVNDLLRLNPEKVNVNGGSIALGHPIGATGARILVTLIHALKRRNLKRGVAALCIGGGEAIAMVIETV